MKTAVSLYLRSQNCFKAMRQNTIKNYFGTIDIIGELHKCENTIKSVFTKLCDKQRHCKTIVDEIHIKPEVHYQGNHAIRYSVTTNSS